MRTRSLLFVAAGLADATATESPVTFAEVVGHPLQADCYVLLGFPLGAAVRPRH